MSVARGDVVLVTFPQAPGQRPKRRPAVVVQSDHNNSRLTSSIFAMVTSNTKLASKEVTQVLIDVGTTDGKQSGLQNTSAVKCENLYTLPIGSARKIGSLSSTLMQRMDDALRASLDIH